MSRLLVPGLGRRIGVIVNDRTVARRARALLERAGVLVRDEAGWPFSTTSAATAIGRWLDVVSGDAYHRDLLDLLKLPFAFHDWPRATRQATVAELAAEAGVPAERVRERDTSNGLGDREQAWLGAMFEYYDRYGLPVGVRPLRALLAGGPAAS